jgi:DNA mismatch endonuclease (patch repair protein)
MSRIRGKNTEPEFLLRSAVWKRGLRYRLHASTPVGRPDLVFPGRQVAVFIDGCFWHGCPDHYVRPRSRDEFWGAKLRENVDRDRRQTLALEALGWRVVRVWEHEVFEQLVEVTDRTVRAVSATEWIPDETWRVVRVDTLPTMDMERRHLEDLRDPARTRTVEQKRSTRKWKRLPA